MTRRSAHNARPVATLPAHLPSLNLNAAGIDIGATSHFVAVPPGRDTVSVREFATFTADLHQLADWLELCGVDTVVMESTGVYVRRITARAIPPAGRMGSEGGPMGQRLTLRRKPIGTAACRRSGAALKTCRVRLCKTRVLR